MSWLPWYVEKQKQVKLFRDVMAGLNGALDEYGYALDEQDVSVVKSCASDFTGLGYGMAAAGASYWTVGRLLKLVPSAR